MEAYHGILRDRVVNRVIAHLTTQHSAAEVNCFEFFQLRPCSGVLISGPTGCGKSTLVNWLVETTQADCISRNVGSNKISKILMSCADLINKVVGDSEKRISEIFAEARSKSPCFLILEDLEIILGSKSRSSQPVNSSNKKSWGAGRTSHTALDRILSMLLMEIDGIAAARSRISAIGSSTVTDFLISDILTVNATLSRPLVVVIATTSDAASLDRALTRPGRLEEHIKMSLPGPDEREKILYSLLAPIFKNLEGMNTDAIAFKNRAVISENDVRQAVSHLVSATNGRAPAELQALVHDLVFEIMRRDLEVASHGRSQIADDSQHNADMLLRHCFAYPKL